MDSILLSEDPTQHLETRIAHYATMLYAYDIMLVMKLPCAVFQGLETADASYFHSELE